MSARWLSVADPDGSPLLRNPYLPCDDPHADEWEATLRAQAEAIHAAGMAAMSWYPMAICQSAWKARPDWRQQYIVPWREGLFCCFESPYGDAVINYCNYAIERLGLDGIWFDGSVWTPIWERPYPLSCDCEYCKRKFWADTGLALPAKLDFADPAFRRWVAWRYREFSGYIGRVAAAIRAAHPGAAVVINHYHRPGIPWYSAVPIDRYAADIISGSEASGLDTVDLTMRLCRAYGRSQSEVWRPFDTGGAPADNADALIHHALGCFAAGGMPSFGSPVYEPRIAETAALMAPVMEAIRPLVGGPSLPYAAIHVSQETETFHFGREPSPYWTVLGVWTSALGKAHLSPDYVYDADFTADGLRPYRVVFLPLSQAMGDDEARAALDYARAGGVLVIGTGAGQLDPEGLPRAANPLGRALGFRFERTPAWDGSDAEQVELWPAEGSGGRIVTGGFHAPLALEGGAWRVLFREGRSADARPAAAVRAFGKGTVFVLGVDPSQTQGSVLVFGGDTSLRVTDETAASGRCCLKYVDGPAAPEIFYPDLETRYPGFGAPRCTGCVLSFDLRVEAGAAVSAELRSDVGPTAGPIVGVGDGQVTVAGQPFCAVPEGQWFHVAVDCDFAREGAPSAFALTVTTPDGAAHTGRFASPDGRFAGTDWLVVYGLGQARAAFYLDNLELARKRPDGGREVALSLDFESGDVGLAESTGFLRALLGGVQRAAPPPLAVAAPAEVWCGAFRAADGRVLVHLHNRAGRLADWLAGTGPAAVLTCRFPVAGARSALAGRDLPVAAAGLRRRVTVPHVGLYQVVELRP
jgi:hypothetical protein